MDVLVTMLPQQQQPVLREHHHVYRRDHHHHHHQHHQHQQQQQHQYQQQHRTSGHLAHQRFNFIQPTMSPATNVEEARLPLNAKDGNFASDYTRSTVSGTSASKQPLVTMRCTCCPYGYHIDLGFLNYLDADDQLIQLRKIKRRRTIERQKMETRLLMSATFSSDPRHQQPLSSSFNRAQRPLSSGDFSSDAASTTSSMRSDDETDNDMPMTAGKILEEIDMSIADALSSIDDLMQRKSSKADRRPPMRDRAATTYDNVSVSSDVVTKPETQTAALRKTVSVLRREFESRNAGDGVGGGSEDWNAAAAGELKTTVESTRRKRSELASYETYDNVPCGYADNPMLTQLSYATSKKETSVREHSAFVSLNFETNVENTSDTPLHRPVTDQSHPVSGHRENMLRRQRTIETAPSSSETDDKILYQRQLLDIGHTAANAITTETSAIAMATSTPRSLENKVQSTDVISSGGRSWRDAVLDTSMPSSVFTSFEEDDDGQFHTTRRISSTSKTWQSASAMGASAGLSISDSCYSADVETAEQSTSRSYSSGVEKFDQTSNSYSEHEASAERPLTSSTVESHRLQSSAGVGQNDADFVAAVDEQNYADVSRQFYRETLASSETAADNRDVTCINEQQQPTLSTSPETQDGRENIANHSRLTWHGATESTSIKAGNVATTVTTARPHVLLPVRSAGRPVTDAKARRALAAARIAEAKQQSSTALVANTVPVTVDTTTVTISEYVTHSVPETESEPLLEQQNSNLLQCSQGEVSLVGDEAKQTTAATMRSDVAISITLPNGSTKTDDRSFDYEEADELDAREMAGPPPAITSEELAKTMSIIIQQQQQQLTMLAQGDQYVSAETIPGSPSTPCSPSPADSDALMTIRRQMADSLQQMRVLERQVKAIPMLQVRLSVLKEEKRLLQLQLLSIKNSMSVAASMEKSSTETSCRPEMLDVEIQATEPQTSASIALAVSAKETKPREDRRTKYQKNASAYETGQVDSTNLCSVGVGDFTVSADENNRLDDLSSSLLCEKCRHIVIGSETGKSVHLLSNTSSKEHQKILQHHHHQQQQQLHHYFSHMTGGTRHFQSNISMPTDIPGPISERKLETESLPSLHQEAGMTFTQQRHLATSPTTTTSESQKCVVIVDDGNTYSNTIRTSALSPDETVTQSRRSEAANESITSPKARDRSRPPPIARKEVSICPTESAGAQQSRTVGIQCLISSSETFTDKNLSSTASVQLETKSAAMTTKVGRPAVSRKPDLLVTHHFTAASVGQLSPEVNLRRSQLTVDEQTETDRELLLAALAEVENAKPSRGKLGVDLVESAVNTDSGWYNVHGDAEYSALTADVTEKFSTESLLTKANNLNVIIDVTAKTNVNRRETCDAVSQTDSFSLDKAERKANCQDAAHLIDDDSDTGVSSWRLKSILAPEHSHKSNQLGIHGCLEADLNRYNCYDVSSDLAYLDLHNAQSFVRSFDSTDKSKTGKSAHLSQFLRKDVVTRLDPVTRVVANTSSSVQDACCGPDKFPLFTADAATMVDDEISRTSVAELGYIPGAVGDRNDCSETALHYTTESVRQLPKLFSPSTSADSSVPRQLQDVGCNTDDVFSEIAAAVNFTSMSMPLGIPDSTRSVTSSNDDLTTTVVSTSISRLSVTDVSTNTDDVTILPASAVSSLKSVEIQTSASASIGTADASSNTELKSFVDTSCCTEGTPNTDSATNTDPVVRVTTRDIEVSTQRVQLTDSAVSTDDAMVKSSLRSVACNTDDLSQPAVRTDASVGTDFAVKLVQPSIDSETNTNPVEKHAVMNTASNTVVVQLTDSACTADIVIEKSSANASSETDDCLWRPSVANASSNTEIVLKVVQPTQDSSVGTDLTEKPSFVDAAANTDAAERKEAFCSVNIVSEKSVSTVSCNTDAAPKPITDEKAINTDAPHLDEVVNQVVNRPVMTETACNTDPVMLTDMPTKAGEDLGSVNKPPVTGAVSGNERRSDIVLVDAGCDAAPNSMNFVVTDVVSDKVNGRPLLVERGTEAFDARASMIDAVSETEVELLRSSISVHCNTDVKMTSDACCNTEQADETSGTHLRSAAAAAVRSMPLQARNYVDTASATVQVQTVADWCVLPLVVDRREAAVNTEQDVSTKTFAEACVNTELPPAAAAAVVDRSSSADTAKQLHLKGVDRAKVLESSVDGAWHVIRTTEVPPSQRAVLREVGCNTEQVVDSDGQNLGKTGPMTVTTDVSCNTEISSADSNSYLDQPGVAKNATDFDKWLVSHIEISKSQFLAVQQASESNDHRVSTASDASKYDKYKHLTVDSAAAAHDNTSTVNECITRTERSVSKESAPNVCESIAHIDDVGFFTEKTDRQLSAGESEFVRRRQVTSAADLSRNVSISVAKHNADARTTERIEKVLTVRRSSVGTERKTSSLAELISKDMPELSTGFSKRQPTVCDASLNTDEELLLNFLETRRLSIFAASVGLPQSTDRYEKFVKQRSNSHALVLYSGELDVDRQLLGQRRASDNFAEIQVVRGLQETAAVKKSTRHFGQSVDFRPTKAANRDASCETEQPTVPDVNLATVANDEFRQTSHVSRPAAAAATPEVNSSSRKSKAAASVHNSDVTLASTAARRGDAVTSTTRTSETACNTEIVWTELTASIVAALATADDAGAAVMPAAAMLAADYTATTYKTDGTGRAVCSEVTDSVTLPSAAAGAVSIIQQTSEPVKGTANVTGSSSSKSFSDAACNTDATRPEMSSLSVSPRVVTAEVGCNTEESTSETVEKSLQSPALSHVAAIEYPIDVVEQFSTAGTQLPLSKTAAPSSKQTSKIGAATSGSKIPTRRSKSMQTNDVACNTEIAFEPDAKVWKEFDQTLNQCTVETAPPGVEKASTVSSVSHGISNSNNVDKAAAISQPKSSSTSRSSAAAKSSASQCDKECSASPLMKDAASETSEMAAQKSSSSGASQKQVTSATASKTSSSSSSGRRTTTSSNPMPYREQKRIVAVKKRPTARDAACTADLSGQTLMTVAAAAAADDQEGVQPPYYLTPSRTVNTASVACGTDLDFYSRLVTDAQNAGRQLTPDIAWLTPASTISSPRFAAAADDDDKEEEEDYHRLTREFDTGAISGKTRRRPRSLNFDSSVEVCDAASNTDHDSRPVTGVATSPYFMRGMSYFPPPVPTADVACGTDVIDDEIISSSLSPNAAPSLSDHSKRLPPTSPADTSKLTAGHSESQSIVVESYHDVITTTTSSVVETPPSTTAATTTTGGLEEERQTLSVSQNVDDEEISVSPPAADLQVRRTSATSDALASLRRYIANSLNNEQDPSAVPASPTRSTTSSASQAVEVSESYDERTVNRSATVDSSWTSPITGKRIVPTANKLTNTVPVTTRTKAINTSRVANECTSTMTESSGPAGDDVILGKVTSADSKSIRIYVVSSEDIPATSSSSTSSSSSSSSTEEEDLNNNSGKNVDLQLKAVATSSLSGKPGSSEEISPPKRNSPPLMTRWGTVDLSDENSTSGRKSTPQSGSLRGSMNVSASAAGSSSALSSSSTPFKSILKQSRSVDPSAASESKVNARGNVGVTTTPRKAISFSQDVIFRGEPETEDISSCSSMSSSSESEVFSSTDFSSKSSRHDSGPSHTVAELPPSTIVATSDALAEACETYALWLRDSTEVNSKQLNHSMSVVRRDWFLMTSQKTSDAGQVADFLQQMASVSPELVKQVVNMVDDNKNTALHYAMSNGRFDVVRQLLDTGFCDVGRQNRAGCTAIMIASLVPVRSEEDCNVIESLIMCSDINQPASALAGQTALMLAASRNRRDIVRMLLDAGADVNAQDDDGSTALMCASEHGYMDIVRMLLEHHGCNPDLEDQEGSTAWAVAMEAGHEDIAVLLYAHSDAFKKSVKQRHKTKSSSSSSKTSKNN